MYPGAFDDVVGVGGHAIENAFDNDPLTHAATSTNSGIRSLRILFDATDIVEVRVTARHDHPDQLGNHYVSFSTDGSIFGSEFHGGGFCETPSSATVVSTPSQVHVHTCVVSGCRGVEVYANFNGHLGIAEFHAYTAVTAPTRPACLDDQDCDCDYEAAALCVGADDADLCTDCVTNCREDYCQGGADDDGYANCITTSFCNS